MDTQIKDTMTIGSCVSEGTSGIGIGSTGSYGTSDNTVDLVYRPYDDWNWNWYSREYFPVYIYTDRPDKYETAFKIMKVMIKNGYIKNITVARHNKMIEDIVAEL